MTNIILKVLANQNIHKRGNSTTIKMNICCESNKHISIKLDHITSFS